MSTDLWTHRDTADGEVDVTGFTVVALDGELGRVKETTDEPGSSYLLVDAGSAIFGREVILPAGLVDRIDPEGERVCLLNTKDEFKHAPELEPGASVDEDYRRRLSAHFGVGATAGQAR